MKNACIVLRNNRTYFYGDEFEPVYAAWLDGGYMADKFFLLRADEPHELTQTLIEAKNFFENVLVIAPQDMLSAVRAKICDVLKVPFGEQTVVGSGVKTFVCVPCGEEGAAAVKAEALPHLDAKYSDAHGRSVLRAVGVPADRLRSVLASLREAEGGGELQCNVIERAGDLRLEILYDGNAPKMRVDEATRIAAEGLREYTYAIDDTPLNRRVVELLKLRGTRLCVAESFTGGGVAQKLVEVPGASAVLFESVVAYDNRAKMQRLGVREETLARFGAVSDETAYEMAAGLLSSRNCDVALATTGIAGPQSDGTNKPVGLCFIAVGTAESVFVYKYIFKGSRNEISARAVNQALYLLYKQIR